MLLALVRAGRFSAARSLPRATTSLTSSASPAFAAEACGGAWGIGGVGAVGGVRGMATKKGFVDTIRDTMEDTKRAKEAEQGEQSFAKMCLAILAKRHFTLGDFKETLQDSMDESGIDGWRGYMPGAQDQAKEMREQLTIMGALNEKELADVGALRRREKIRVAEEVGITVQEVNAFLRQYESANMMHSVSGRPREGGGGCRR
jgi:hypothetical protein